MTSTHDVGNIPGVGNAKIERSTSLSAVEISTAPIERSGVN